MFYKNIIVGGGIAGLTLAYYFEKLGENYILFEKADHFGGRAINIDFHGANIPLGAGVIRKDDKCVRNLCKELGLELNTWESTMMLHPTIHVSLHEQKWMIRKIKSVYTKNAEKITGNFREFINTWFPAEFVMKFEQIVGHNDFWEADVKDVMIHYPLNELLVFPAEISAIQGGWNVLVDKLVDVTRTNLRAETGVVSIDWDSKTIETDDGKKYTCKRLFLCGDISLKNISLNLPKGIMNTLDHIQGVNFLRMYTYHPQKFDVPFLKVPTILQKLIPISDTVLMSAYTEDYQSNALKNILERKAPLYYVNKLIKNSIADTGFTVTPAIDVAWKWWEAGIHYYTPHKNPLVKSAAGVYLLGEMASDNQGWVEGAVESVYKTICKIYEKCL